jgi:hypothetical protein
MRTSIISSKFEETTRLPDHDELDRYQERGWEGGYRPRPYTTPPAGGFTQVKYPTAAELANAQLAETMLCATSQAICPPPPGLHACIQSTLHCVVPVDTYFSLFNVANSVQSPSAGRPTHPDAHGRLVQAAPGRSILPSV